VRLARALGWIVVAAAIALAAGYAVRGNMFVAAVVMLVVYAAIVRATAATAPDTTPSRDT
jgi:hypothetical protein